MSDLILQDWVRWLLGLTTFVLSLIKAVSIFDFHTHPLLLWLWWHLLRYWWFTRLYRVFNIWLCMLARLSWFSLSRPLGWCPSVSVKGRVLVLRLAYFNWNMIFFCLICHKINAVPALSIKFWLLWQLRSFWRFICRFSFEVLAILLF